MISEVEGSVTIELVAHPDGGTLAGTLTMPAAEGVASFEDLVIDIAAQYNGRNNGDLCAPLSVMRKLGWKSSDQLFKARKDIVDRGLVQVAREGGLNKCTLYALTWFPIDECDGKLDIASTITAPNDWKHPPDPNGGLKKP